MDPIRMLVVEDQPLMRVGLQALVASSSDVKVVGEVDSVESALLALGSCGVDVVLLDLDLGGGDGALSAVGRIADVAAYAKILAMVATRDPERHRAALLAGARGIVTKDRPGDVLLKAIYKVASGELWFGRQVLERTLSRSVSRYGDPPLHEAVTDREQEIVVLVSEGLTNSEIASRLRIRRKTVSNHLTSIFDKLGVSGRAQLLVRAFQLGMATVPRAVPRRA